MKIKENSLYNTIVELGFNKIDYCNGIYIFKSKVIILVYVDDFEIFAGNREVLEEVIQLIRSKFELKMLGTIRHFLEIHSEEINGEYFMCQRDYIETLAQIFKVSKIHCKLLLTPGIMLNTTMLTR